MAGQSIPLQALRSYTITVCSDVTIMLFLRRLPYTWKFEFGVQLCGVLPVGSRFHYHVPASY